MTALADTLKRNDHEGCRGEGGAIVCSPPKAYLRSIQHCPTCQCRRRFSGFHQVWYGTTWTCLGCGDSWEDVHRLPRPFKRGWRAEAIAKAKKNWDEAMTDSEFRTWLDVQLGVITAELDTSQMPEVGADG